MFIQTESTPNPATLKFLPGRIVLGDRVMEFANVEEAKASALAAAIFQVPDVLRVFFGSDFISVTKAKGEWQHLKPAILGAIMEHYTRGLPILEGEAPIKAGAAAEDSEIVAQIKELLDTRIRPAVAQDGGDIAFEGFDEPSGVVFLRMQGSCSGCPSSRMTLKNGVENMLRHYIPEVSAVEAV
ncbi:MAG: NifU family protein [Alphaproteobacteria bacterium]|nr:NifU family protein [Alphaproteobacteria bacterium]